MAALSTSKLVDYNDISTIELKMMHWAFLQIVIVHQIYGLLHLFHQVIKVQIFILANQPMVLIVLLSCIVAWNVLGSTLFAWNQVWLQKLIILVDFLHCVVKIDFLFEQLD